MASSIASLLIPAALFLGEPANVPHATYERGLFCDSVGLVASIVRIADRGGDPHKAVSDLNRTLDRNEQNQQVVQMLKIASEEVPAIPVYFNFAPTAYLSSLKGPTMGARVPDARVYWDMYNWDWQ